MNAYLKDLGYTSINKNKKEKKGNKDKKYKKEIKTEINKYFMRVNNIFSVLLNIYNKFIYSI
jgi:hypothetical protein